MATGQLSATGRVVLYDGEVTWNVIKDATLLDLTRVAGMHVCFAVPPTGVCNLCNSAVRFIIKHDPKRNLLFCSAQSPKAEPYLRG